jgi:hypothetical protein
VDGYTQVYGKNFTFASVRASGHLVPQDQPARALTLFKGFLSGKPLVEFVPVGFWMPARLSFCFHTGVGSLGFWRPTQMYYESGLGFKVFFWVSWWTLGIIIICASHNRGSNWVATTSTRYKWGINLFPLWNTSTKQKRFGQADN